SPKLTLDPHRAPASGDCKLCGDHAHGPSDLGGLVASRPEVPVKLDRFNVFAGMTPAEVKALLVLGPGSFVMASTIGTINVGLPAVQDEFGVSLSALKWVSIMGAI